MQMYELENMQNDIRFLFRLMVVVGALIILTYFLLFRIEGRVSELEEWDTVVVQMEDTVDRINEVLDEEDRDG
jgi:hypothetical protein